MFVTETWLTESNNHVTATIKALGYRVIHKIRSNSEKSRGGGVAIIYHSSYNVSQVFIKHGETFEAVCVKFRDNDGENICCGCVYRPGIINEAFYSDFDEFIGTIFLKFAKIMLCGDLNIHLDNSKSRNSIKLGELISSYGLSQIVTVPTHKAGHLLDVVICSHKMVEDSSVKINKLDASIFPSCDHLPIIFNLKNNSQKSANELKTITFRNLRGIVTEDFRNDLSCELSELVCETNSFENIIHSYNSKCSTVLDQHAPLISKQIRDRGTAPWFDGEYKSLRNLRRKAERQWKKHGTAKDREHYIELRTKCSELSFTKKKDFFSEQFHKHNHSPKSLFRFVDDFMDKNKDITLPQSDSLKDTVDRFNAFFEEKINLIRSKFNDSVIYDSSLTEDYFTGTQLCNLEPTSVEEILEIFKDSEFKSSTVDSLPASLLKDNLEVMLPVLCDIVNASLSSGSIDGAKLAHITPLIKGQSLDSSEFKNYRPISNLSFVGKLIERVVLRRLNDHLTRNNLNIPLQSGYKKSHSTETLLIRIVNDLLIASSENKATVVMLLDLSAAFDTVDHRKLLNILKREIGIVGTAWQWFESFLTGRCQRVRVDGEESAEIIIKFGVPQGSVLGPVLFNIYIRSLYATVKELKFAIHGYADDHQVYKSFSNLEEYTVLVNDVPFCFKQISEWMSRHYLQLNPGKTEIIVFGSPATLNDLQIQGVFLNQDACIRLSPVVKNLGFRLDCSLTFRKQVVTLKSACFNKLRYIAKMKAFLNTKQMSILVQAVIISSLDYCNALYYGCSKSVLGQLQVIQNRACRVIFGLKKRDSVEEKYKSLHWLKIEERIEFKFLLLVYKSLHGLAPSYLSDLLFYNNITSDRTPSLHISSSNQSCTRAYQVAAPKLWSQLPYVIRESETVDIFKSLLKTHLFKRSYNM